MALIFCPKCGKRFSDRADKCPQCGISKEEIQRLLAEKEAQIAAEAVERERLRKEQEAKEAEEARLRAEKRAEWWKKNRKKIFFLMVTIVIVVLSIVSYIKIKNLIEKKRTDQNIEVAIAAGDSCVHIRDFEKAKVYYNKALDYKNDQDLHSRIEKKFEELVTIQCEDAIEAGDSCVQNRDFDKAGEFYGKALDYKNNQEIRNRVWDKLKELNIQYEQFNKNNVITKTKSQKILEVDGVYISLPTAMEDFLSELGISNTNISYDNHFYFGNISYKANNKIAPEIDIREHYGDYEEILCFPLNKLGDNRNYVITSNEYGGFKLSVIADKDNKDGFIYKEITLVHPLNNSPYGSSSYDSIVCTNLKLEQKYYGIGLDNSATRPCSGYARVFRIDGKELHLSKEMLAIENRTIWKEYYENGEVKSEKEIINNPDEIDANGFAAFPYQTITR